MLVGRIYNFHICLCLHFFVVWQKAEIIRNSDTDWLLKTAVIGNPILLLFFTVFLVSRHMRLVWQNVEGSLAGTPEDWQFWHWAITNWRQCSWMSALQQVILFRTSVLSLMEKYIRSYRILQYHIRKWSFFLCKIYNARNIRLVELLAMLWNFLQEVIIYTRSNFSLQDLDLISLLQETSYL